MTNQNIVGVDILIRSGSRGTQAMWAVYRCPLSGKNMTVWGAVKTPTGATPTLAPDSQSQVSLVFSNSKETSGDISKLYALKMKKYERLGRYELDITNLQVEPLGTSQNKATLSEQSPPAGKFDNEQENNKTLPREVTHPEACKSGNSESLSWFF